MPFQNAVNKTMAVGVPGELFANFAHKVETFSINSASAAYNVIGKTCCTVSDQLKCEAGAGGAFGFAGFLVNPKGQALGDFLAPSLTVPNNSIVECLTMGTLIVTLPSPANIGDYIVFDNITGEISAISTMPFQLSGGLTNNDATVTMADTTGVIVGQAVSGTGIPAGTTVDSIVPNTSIELSQNATATATEVLTFVPSGNDLPSGTTFAQAKVDYFIADGVSSQLAVITVSPTYQIPS